MECRVQERAVIARGQARDADALRHVLLPHMDELAVLAKDYIVLFVGLHCCNVIEAQAEDVQEMHGLSLPGLEGRADRKADTL